MIQINAKSKAFSHTCNGKWQSQRKAVPIRSHLTLPCSLPLSLPLSLSLFLSLSLSPSPSQWPKKLRSLMIIHCLLLHHHYHVCFCSNCCCCCCCNACNFLIAGFDFGFDENLICNQDRAQITVHKNCFLKGKQQCASCRSTLASSRQSSTATATATATTATSANTIRQRQQQLQRQRQHQQATSSLATEKRHRQSKCASLHSMTAITLLICCCQCCCCCSCCCARGVHSYCLLMRKNT